MRDGIYWFSGGKQDWSCLAIQMQNEYFLAIKRNNIVLIFKHPHQISNPVMLIIHMIHYNGIAIHIKGFLVFLF